jgi:hypothetical protein
MIIWAAGQIYHIPLSNNRQGEKVPLGEPRPILFTAHIEKRIAETRRGGTDVIELETANTMRVRALKELRVDDEGKRAVFQAAGVTFVQDVTPGSSLVPQKVPVLHATAPYYSPSFVQGADNLVIHSRWSDTNFTTFELANLTSGIAYELDGLPLGRYYSPVLCECAGNERQLAFIRTAGDTLSGDVVATAGAGLYIGDIILPRGDYPTSDKVTVRNIRFIPSQIDTNDLLKMRFAERNSKLLVQQSSKAYVIDLGAGPKNLGEYVHYTLASGRMSAEIVVSLRSSKGSDYSAENVGFVDFFHVYLAPSSSVSSEPAWSKPGNATKKLARLSIDGGHDVTFSRDGQKIFWLSGKSCYAVITTWIDMFRFFEAPSFTLWKFLALASVRLLSKTTNQHLEYLVSRTCSIIKRSSWSIPQISVA